MSVLEWFPPEPARPTYAELSDAVLQFAREFYAVGPTEHKGTPADLVLLGLAERIEAAKEQTNAKAI